MVKPPTRLRVPKRKRQVGESELLVGDAHLNELRHLVQAQIGMQDAVENANDDNQAAKAEALREANWMLLVQAADALAQRPAPTPRTQQMGALNDQERSSIRELYKLVEALKATDEQAPSDSELEALNGKARTLKETLAGAQEEDGDIETWLPSIFRILDIMDDGYDKQPQSSDEESLLFSDDVIPEIDLPSRGNIFRAWEERKEISGQDRKLEG
ncbi:MAG: hypothetical protein M1839_001949 [Geoglossum umbratile]|nr:MAG: hypothetical protein M1839_001949 [Geoglossum umbratile]